MPRGLSEEFMHDLVSGCLKPLFDEIKQDDTLDLQIREDYLNIYYRGGSLIKLSRDPENSEVYLAVFDDNYCRRIQTNLALTDCIDDNETVHAWAAAIPEMKRCMDRFFYRHPKNEREFAQNFVRENNRTKIITPGPDYFICDVEYNFTVPGAKGQFDAIAVRWDSTAIARKKAQGLRLALIEFKFGDGALAGKAGIEKHIADAEKFLGAYSPTAFREEMKQVFNQKRKLGYILNQKNIESISDEKPEYIFVLANHDPATTGLKQVLNRTEEPSVFDLKFGRANFYGAGLYGENIISLEDFRRLVKKAE